MPNDSVIKIQLNPQDIPFITKIFEGYDGLALVSTIDGKAGLVKLNVTPETKQEVLDILNNFPKNFILLSV